MGEIKKKTESGQINQIFFKQNLLLFYDKEFLQ